MSVSSLYVQRAFILLASWFLFLLPICSFGADESSPEDPSRAVEKESTEQTIPRLDARGNEVHPLVAESKALQDSLNQIRDRIRKLESELDQSEGEERQIVDRQVAESKMEALRLLDDLVANLVEQEKEGLDTTELRPLIEQVVSNLGPKFIQHIESSEERVVQLFNQRQSVELKDLIPFERKLGREIQYLQALFRGYANLVRQLDLLGLDSRAVRKDLEERLIARADRLSGRMQLMTEELVQLRKRTEGKPADSETKMLLEAAEERKSILAAALSDAVRVMDDLNLDSSKYRKVLMESTGEVTIDIFRKGVFGRLLREWIQQSRDWAKANLPSLTFRLIVFFFILIAFWVISRIIKRLMLKGAVKSGSSLLLQTVIQSWTTRAIMTIGLLVGLSQLGVQIGPLLAGLGIAGFIVGFALQDSLSNFAAGVMILVYRPFDQNDWVEAGGVLGKVSAMSLVATTILSLDNQTLVVPNSKIWGDTIRNITHQKIRMVDMKFRISYSDDVDRTEELLYEIIRAHPKVLEDPEPKVRLHELGESAVIFVARPWVATSDYWEVYWYTTREVKRRFDAEGISIPVPQREIRIRKED